MENLTARQRDILEYVERQQSAKGYPPTNREIALRFGFKSPKAVTDHLAALERKGYIARATGTARGLRVLKGTRSDAQDAPVGIPIVGDVAAGLPILATENVMGMLSMDQAFGPGDLFAVRVRGDSMIDYGIFEGDFVIVRRSPIVDNNAIAVAYIEGEATVKKIRKTSHGYELIPGNANYQPICITECTPDFSVAGPVVGVVRSMKQRSEFNP